MADSNPLLGGNVGLSKWNKLGYAMMAGGGDQHAMARYQQDRKDKKARIIGETFNILRKIDAGDIAGAKEHAGTISVQMQNQGLNPTNFMNLDQLLTTDPKAARQMIIDAGQDAVMSGDIDIKGNRGLERLLGIGKDSGPIRKEKRIVGYSRREDGKGFDETEYTIQDKGDGPRAYEIGTEKLLDLNTLLSENNPEVKAQIERDKSEIAVEKEGMMGLKKADVESILAGVGNIENYRSLTRNLHMLETVETGGLDAIKLWAKGKVGMQTADEAELVYNFSKNVMAQLRPTFGAAFTKAEGDWLKEIEAGITKGNPGNLRLLQEAKGIIQRSMTRAISLAEAMGDTEKADYIRKGLTYEADGLGETKARKMEF